MNEESHKKDISKQKDSDFNANTGLILKAFEDRDFISKRTEKIVAALYLISGLMPENDPLRISLRNQSIELMSLITTALRLGITNAQNYIAENVVIKIDHLVSLMRIGQFSGYVSEMNFKILKDELESFSEYLGKDSKESPLQFVLPENFLASGTPISNQLSGAASGRGFIKDNPFYKGQTVVKNPRTPIEYKASASNKGDKINNSSDKDSRKNVIVGLLKKHRDMTIKDISANFDDCSEKTIQRELASLIANKVIQRKGERRWSTYSIVS